MSFNNIYLTMNVSHLNIYAVTIPDRMHHLDLGLFNYQVTYTRELLKEMCGQIAVDELDNRLARIPRFPGLKIFKNGLENIKRFTADEFRNMMKVFIFVIEGIIKKHHKAAISTNHRSEEHTSELQSQSNLVCRLLLEKKK